MELCKFYMNDCCAKRDKCLYMHHDFPCKFHHTGQECPAGERNCKFSHGELNEVQLNALVKVTIHSLAFSPACNKILTL